MRCDVLQIGAAESLELARLLPVGADDAHAGERLLRDRAQVGELRLDPLEALVDHAAEVARDERDDRQREERDQRQAAG